MNRLLNALAHHDHLVSDGAWGTFLQQKGLRSGACPELWNCERPDDVRDIAERYCLAGADIVGTNSFGASPLKLAHYGLDARTEELNRAAAAISRRAAGNRVVIGSVGPTGKMLITGDINAQQLYDGFARQCTALAEGGVDALCIETMADIEEACRGVRAAAEKTSLPVIATFTFEKTVQGEYRTMMGVAPADIVEPLKQAGASVIGTNCGNGIAGMIDIVEQLRAVDAAMPILVHANAGLPVQTGTTVTYPENPERMARQVPALVRAGATIIGGCCGTTPEHIKAIAAVLHD